MGKFLHSAVLILFALDNRLQMSTTIFLQPRWKSSGKYVMR